MDLRTDSCLLSAFITQSIRSWRHCRNIIWVWWRLVQCDNNGFSPSKPMYNDRSSGSSLNPWETDAFAYRFKCQKARLPNRTSRHCLNARALESSQISAFYRFFPRKSDKSMNWRVELTKISSFIRINMSFHRLQASFLNIICRIFANRPQRKKNEIYVFDISQYFHDKSNWSEI